MISTDLMLIEKMFWRTEVENDKAWGECIFLHIVKILTTVSKVIDALI